MNQLIYIFTKEGEQLASLCSGQDFAALMEKCPELKDYSFAMLLKGVTIKGELFKLEKQEVNPNEC